MNTTLPDKALTTLLTALTPVIWGTTFVLSSEVLPQGVPLTTAAIRTLPAGFALLLLTRSFRPEVPMRRLLVLSLLNIAAFQALLFVAAQRLPGGIAAVVGALQPLMIVFLTWWFDQRKPHALTLAAAGLGMAGMGAVFVTSGGRFDTLGLLAAFAGSASLAAGTYLAVRWRGGMPLLPFIGWKLALGGLILLVPSLFIERELPPLSHAQWMGYANLSLLGTVVAYILWFRGLAVLPPVSVSALSLLTPVTALLLGWLLLGESLQPGQMAGIAVVLVSVGALQVTAAWSHRAALRPFRTPKGYGPSTEP